MQDLKSLVAEVADFPKPGILFRDISPLLRQRFHDTMTAVDDLYCDEEWGRIDAIAGVESRGFIFAAALADRRRKGFVLIRKKGKLPPPVVDIAYELEYGTGVLEMPKGEGRLLLVDDVLATGGTLLASTALAVQAGFTVQAVAVLIDLGMAPGFRCAQHAVRSVIQYG